MIYYLTKKTADRFNIPMPDQLVEPIATLTKEIVKKEKENKMLQWGGKILYFDHRKCIQIIHFASKMTIFLVDVKVSDISYIGDCVIRYLLHIYRNEDKIVKLIKRLCSESPVIVFDRITDKGIISTLNHTESDWALNGYKFYDYIDKGILKTKEMNEDLNKKWIFTMKNGKTTDYFSSYEKFKEILTEYYKK